MKILKAAGLAGVLALGATQAMAWGDMYMGDQTENNPNSMPVQAYHGPNYCPAGLQPIVMGGVICCGTADQPVQMSMPKKGKTKTH
ncbi:hypothetical protein [Primorskyibacter sp. S187A]|uniref:hypothetical protein n=1 Tax=Primorskyibacter sp. S187A TaxID=3415130 RepID=UPI003C7C9AAB